MSAFITVMRHEMRAAWRLRRARMLMVLHAGVSLLPVVGLAVTEGSGPQASGWLLPSAMLPFLRTATLFAGFLLAVDSVPRERHEGSFGPLAHLSLGNAAFIAGRFGALATMMLGLAAFPMLVAWVAGTMLPGPPPDPQKIAAAFVLDILPAVPLGVGLGLCLGIVARTALAALIALIAALAAFQSFGNDALARFGLTIEGPGSWLFDGTSIAMPLQAVFIPDAWWQASDAPRSWADDWAPSLAPAVVPVALAGLALAAAVLLLQRTMPDVRPRPLRAGHPLPTVHAALNALRQRFAFEPALGWRDGLGIVAGLLIAATAVSWHVHRASRIRKLAVERSQAEAGPSPAPMDPAFALVSWEVEATLDEAGRVTSSTRLTIRNDGSVPASHLAFALNPFLRVERAVARARPLVFTQQWDRLLVDVDPPAAPGETMGIELGVAGAPAVMSLESGRGLFAQWFEGQRDARIATQLVDLARHVRIRRCASPRLTRLDGADLGPVPRHQAWELVTETSGDTPALIVAPDESAQPTDVSLSLRARGATFLADSCGHVAAAQDGETHLEGRCVAVPSSLVVAGGRLRPLDVPPGSGAAAVLPGHASSADALVALLPRLRELAADAWPSLPPMDLVLVESPAAEDATLSDSWKAANAPPIEASGALVFLDEHSVIGAHNLEAAPLVADAVTRTLLRRRSIRSDAHFIAAIVRRVVARRLSAGSDTGAVIMDMTWDDARAEVLKMGPWYLRRSRRVDAIVGALEAKVGREMLAAGIESFLSGAGEGSASGLIGEIGRAGHRDLAPFEAQFINLGLTPQLTLKDVVFERVGDAWRARGSVVNMGTGEVECPVVLSTDLDPVETSVVVSQDAPAVFELVTRHAPQRVALDPARRCFRARPRKGVGVVESVDFRRIP